LWLNLLLLLLGDVLACNRHKNKITSRFTSVHVTCEPFRANRELTTPALTHTDAGKICF